MVAMITTIDNPWDPFTQWKEWYAYDEEKGYCTCSYLARIAKTGTELTAEQQDLANEQAIDEIIRINGLGFYKKVYENDEFYTKKRENIDIK